MNADKQPDNVSSSFLWLMLSDCVCFDTNVHTIDFSHPPTNVINLFRPRTIANSSARALFDVRSNDYNMLVITMTTMKTCVLIKVIMILIINTLH